MNEMSALHESPTTVLGKAPVITLEDCAGKVGSSSNSLDFNSRSNFYVGKIKIIV